MIMLSYGGLMLHPTSSHPTVPLLRHLQPSYIPTAPVNAEYNPSRVYYAQTQRFSKPWQHDLCGSKVPERQKSCPQ
jgi:hypothetical protein